MPRDGSSFKNFHTSDQWTTVLQESLGFALELKFNDISEWKSVSAESSRSFAIDLAGDKVSPSMAEEDLLDLSFYKLWGCKEGRTDLPQDPSQDCWAQWKLLCLCSRFPCWGLSRCLEVAMQQDLASPRVSGLSCAPPESCPHAHVLLPAAVDGNSCHAFSEEKDWVLLHCGYFILPDFDVKIKT